MSRKIILSSKMGDKMKEILEKYSTRLINISGRNRSLVLKKLYKKRAFDIMRLSEFDEKISTKLIEFLSSRSNKEIQISEDMNYI